ncbi:MAG: DUF4465 domain-containing protein [Paludibacteraceae bacterium]|nr:DUF4465 domain-containing protein [Paludibacteraceae bacterium]
MKKIYLFSVMLLFTGMQVMATEPRKAGKATEETQAATFEDVSAGINEIWGDGVNQWYSGDFTFTTYKDGTYAPAYYYYSFIVSDDTEKTSTGYMEPYRSTSGGAYEGDNFCVWTYDYSGNNGITFTAQTVQGFFVNNNAYTVEAFVNGTQAPARKFTYNDELVLFVIGKKAGAVVDTVKVELASKGRYIADWTYVDLSGLGEIDEILFAMQSTDRISYDNGITYYDNAPLYFCLDNFGSAKPEGYVAPDLGYIPDATALDDVESNARAEKVVVGNELYIIRNGEMYDLQGRKH